MVIYPAIDLIDGTVVRLHKGDFAQKTTYGSNPIGVACGYREAGASWLHLVDLDGAKDPQNRQIRLLGEIISASGLKVQTGGGIRSRADVAALAQAGASRIVIGSLAVRDPDAVRAMFDEFGSEMICLASDVMWGQPDGDEAGYYIAVSGWQEASAMKLSAFLQAYDEVGLRHVLCTDIARDGTMTGCNFDLYQEVKRAFPGVKLQASGGVSSLADLETLTTDGVIIGKALYEGAFQLADALAVGAERAGAC